ncbi:MAG: two-component system regulatory protein YycI [Lactobacillus sp.]|jgi:regulatory protein YycI of two-component signal transduction system YycFG|nr:two-component system regulatory protein YycI [Lactobacillus sp.]MCI2032999.1 two-component system regulatory protein YycI [Lactobacillus sp.]
MDFRRIEWIFLIVFIGLNIFLGISFYQSQEVDQAVSESTASEIVADIQRDQIKLPKLSTKTPTGGYLASQTNTALLNNRAQLVGIDTTITNNSTLHATLRTPVTVKKDKAVSFLKSWLQDSQHVLFGKHYQYAESLSTGTRYVFCQQIQGHKIYDQRAQITFYVVNNKLTGYTQTYISKMSVLKSNVELTSAQDAVLALYKDNELANNAKVVWVELAYNYLLDTKGSTVYVPTWFVGIENQGAKSVTIKKLNAITKTVVKERD